ncbi:hypothetical protein HUU62_10355 [Rhodoferax sp. 4810]|nr:hypothetical protein [Rhodoferax jenense]
MPEPANRELVLNANSEAMPIDDIAGCVLVNEPAVSSLGQIDVSPAAQALLTRLNLQPSFLLGWHKMNEAGAIDLLGQVVASQSVTPCCPVVTNYDTDLGTVEVVTDICSDAGLNRIRTRMMLPGEQL